MIESWVKDLAQPSEFNNNVPRCPFALQVYEAGEVKTVVTDDLWSDVLHECAGFNAKGYKVAMFFDYDYTDDYQSLEDRCHALNSFFSDVEKDIWLLAFHSGTEGVVFVQRWSDLENAAAKLEKLGYYKNYEPDDYKRHILMRRQRSV